MNDLLVFHSDNAVFADYSKDSADFLRDDYALDFIAIEDELYLGLYKPFNSFFVELKTVAIGAQLSFEINGNPLSVVDDTKNLERNGFINFEKPTSWAKETINGVEAYWVKLNSSVDFTAEIQGLNLVFSDDNDLFEEARELNRMLAKGDTSFIAYHVSARNEIIQTLRNGGNIKESGGKIKNITKWDILDRGEIKQASKYLTLAKVFFDVSVNNEDKFYQKFRDYQAMFSKAFNLYIMHLDSDDNGIAEDNRDVRINSIEIEIL